MAIRNSRSERRAHYDQPTRITLLEEDSDESERRHDAIEKKLDSIRTFALTSAVGFAVSALLLAANIARGG